MSILIPVYNLPSKYATDLNVAYATATTLSVTAGRIRDNTNTCDIVIPSALTLNGAARGVNGLDTGVLVLSTIYAVHAIGSSANAGIPGVMLSLSTTAPTMPFGYDIFSQIGWAFTDGAVHFLPFVTLGNSHERTHYWETAIQVLNAGTQNGSYLAVDCSAAIPPVTNTFASCDVSFTPATAADSVSFRPTGSSATQVRTLSSVVASKAQQVQMKLLTRVAAGKAEFDYQNSAASGSTTVYVSSFDFHI